MNCQEVDQSLAAYLHGEVGRSERELIRAHIAQCPRCQNALSRLSELQSDLARSLHAAADSAAPSAAAWARLQDSLAPQRQLTLADRVRQSFGSGSGSWAVPRTLLFLASVAIVSAVTFSLALSPRSQSQPAVVASPAPAIAPTVVPAALPADVRRISGPIDESNQLRQPLSDQPAVVLASPDVDVPPVTGGAGDWFFLQRLAQEGRPFRACASCAQFQ